MLLPSFKTEWPLVHQSVMEHLVSENYKICNFYPDFWLFDHKTILPVVLAVHNLWTKLELTVYAISFLSCNSRWHTDGHQYVCVTLTFHIHSIPRCTSSVHLPTTYGCFARKLNTFPISALCMQVSDFDLSSFDLECAQTVPRDIDHFQSFCAF